MPLTKVASSMIVGGSTGGGGSVGKNYISQYNNGSCNGDFESGNSVGWNLCTVSSISNGLPSGLTVGAGSVATSVISTGQIAGQFSLQTIYPNVANQGIITDVFTIDTEDQAKVMTFKFYYNVTSGASVANFSGTSSNTFIVGIYAVNGSNIGWIQPAGVYSMTQSSGGSGIATGTFQTYSDATQYRFAILCANAPSGSVTMVIDDVYLGPETAPIGAVVTDWVSYTPTGAWTTNTTYSGRWRRVGDTIEVDVGVSLSGAPNAVTLTVNYLPSGLSIDTSKMTLAQQFIRIGYADGTALPAAYNLKAIYNTSTSVLIAYQNNLNASEVVVNATAPITWANGNTIHMRLSVPIAGWSSQVQLSSDTDTRVVAARFFRASTQAVSTTAATKVLLDSTTFDTHSGFQVANNRYIIPVSGFYRITGSVFGSAIATNFIQTMLYRNGSSFCSSFQPSNLNSDATAIASDIVQCNAGDFIELFVSSGDSSYTVQNASSNTYLSIERLSGPAVVAASESVNANYFTTSTGAMAVGTPAVVVFGTRSFDSHNAYNSTTGIYTVPVSGKYQVNATITSASTSQIQSLVLDIMKNGSTWNRFQASRLAAVSSALSTINSAIVSVNAGDTIEIRCSVTSGTGNFNGQAFDNNFTIARVGN